MKFVTDLGKGVLGQADSVELWEEIISHIPDSVLTTPGVKILSVASGHCIEAVVIAKRMMALGVSKSDVNKSIWLVDKFTVFTNFAKMNYGFTNVFTEDFLEWKTNMKFDVVIGNPPYQNGNQGLWQHFATKSIGLIKDNGILAFVTPNSWANGSHLNTSRNIFNSVFQKYQTTIINTNVNNHFTGIGKNIGYWIIEKRDYCSPTIIVSPKETVKVNIKKYPFFINEFSSIGLSIFEKIINKKSFWSEFVEGPSRYEREFAFPKAKHSSYIFGYKYDGGDYNFPTSKAVLGIDCTNHSLASIENISSQFNSTLFKFLWKIYGANDAGSFGWILRSMPKLKVSSKKWTNKQIYKHFSLTQDEIDYIESNVK